MYIQIQELKALGFSKRKTARLLMVNRDTVRSYWDMTDDEYTALAEQANKQSSLVKFEPVILSWLRSYPNMTSAQVYDWLLEHYKVGISERSVRRYINELRRNHDIAKTTQPRDFEAVEDLPMGYQAQVDFGQLSMRTPGGQYSKVYFIGVVFSHSRYKWGYFLDRPFCSVDLVNCLDMCFKHCGGAPNQLVFDQDSTVTVSENYGDIIYTFEFEKYRKLHSLNIYLCRRADPVTKGKVESVVKFIKGNFLPNRLLMDVEILNRSFEDWLERTGNRKVHGTTKKVPAAVFELERTHLRPILTSFEISSDEIILRKVRKDNTILYESNRYSVPLGTYNREKEVRVDIKDDKLVISQAFNDYTIAEHNLCTGKGNLIKNTNHGRNREHGIDELFSDLSGRLEGLCDDFLQEIRRRKSRYVRDQCGLIDRLIWEYGVSSVIIAAQYCREHELYSATDLKDTLEYQAEQDDRKTLPVAVPIRLVINSDVATIVTQKRSIGAYANIGGK